MLSFQALELCFIDGVFGGFQTGRVRAPSIGYPPFDPQASGLEGGQQLSKRGVGASAKHVGHDLPRVFVLDPPQPPLGVFSAYI